MEAIPDFAAAQISGKDLTDSCSGEIRRSLGTKQMYFFIINQKEMCAKYRTLPYGTQPFEGII